jgi:DinB superfamily
MTSPTDPRVFLADQLRRVHSGSAWHGPSLREALGGVTAAMATTKVLPSAHSIYALAHHVAAWADEVLQRLHGRAAQQPDDGDFPDPAAAVDDLAWTRLLARLDAVHAKVIEAVLALDPSLLERKAGDEDSPPLGTGHTFQGMINGLVQHDAYHAGQILLLKRALLAHP